MNRYQKLVKNDRAVSYQPPIASIYELLSHHAKHTPDKEALIGVDVDRGQNTTVTYEKLLTSVIKTANWLKKKGISADHRFAILLSNTPEILLLELAGGLLGATTVPLDTKRDTLTRKLFKIKDTGARLVFTKTDIQTEELKRLSHAAHVKTWESFDEFLKQIDSQPTTPTFHPRRDLSSLYLILYTSGTTALPKGVPLTTQALVANAEGILKWQNLTFKDQFNIILPLHHINSTTMSLATLLAGGTIVISSRYSTSRFWKTIESEKCTITSIVPTIIHDLLVRYEEFIKDTPDISSLKRILIGSAPVLPQETLKFYKLFKIRVIQGYGQTETALRVTGVPIDLSKKSYTAAVKSNTIGIELKNCNVTILKSDGTEAKEKEEGEICIRGPVMAEGYWQNTVETKKAFYSGWFHSGDLGYYEIKNGQKYFYIIGRLKEIIIKGGINLSPATIEDEILKSFPEIDEVSVVGYPDDRMGEEIAAVIVPKPSPVILNAVKDQAKRKNVPIKSGLDSSPTAQNDIVKRILEAGQQNKIPGLSPYEIPKKVFIVDSLPKTSTGKIQRVEVKKMVAKLLGSDFTKTGLTLRYYVRQILPAETQILKEIVKINNQRWQGLPSTLKEFAARAQNGLFFGVFEEKEGLIGSISCVQMDMIDVQKLKTWNEATANGILSNHDPKGDTLLCVAISVAPSSPSFSKTGSGGVNNETMEQFNNLGESQLKLLVRRHIEEYVNSNQDHVLNFHKKPKGGLPGATVWKILENGRPEDKEAMGYNVLMKYPDLTQVPKIIKAHDSPSIMLIEHVLDYAKKHGIKNVLAFSRPAGFKKYLTL